MISPVLHTVIRGIRAMLLGNGASKFFLISFEFLIAGLLGAAFFGHYVLATSLPQIVAYLCLLGLNFGVVQYLTKYEGDANRRANVVVFSLAAVGMAAFLCSLVFASVSDFLAHEVFNKPELARGFLLASPIIFFDAVNQLISSIFRGLRQFGRSLAVYDILRNAVCFIGFPFLYFAGAEFTRVIMLCVAAGAVGTVYGLAALCRQGLLSFQFTRDNAVFREVMDFSKPLFLWSLLLAFAARPYIVGGIFLTPGETGILTLAARVTLLFTFFQTAVNSATVTEFAKFHHEKDTVAQRDLYQAVSQGLLAVVSILGIAFFVNPPYVLGFIGQEYAQAGWVLLPMVFAHYFNTVAGPGGHFLIANDRPKVTIGLTVYDFAAILLVYAPLAFAFGLAGAVAGETFRLVSFVCIRLFIINRDFGVHLAGRSYFRIALAAALSVAAGMFLTLVAGAHYVVAAGVALALYGGCGIYILYTDKMMQEELRAILRFKSS